VPRLGRSHLADVPGLDELCPLIERVIGDASPLGASSFAGWRAVSLPDDAPGRASQLLHVLREHRGGSHAAAVLAAGLTPLEAIMSSGETAPQQAALFGWSEPYPDPASTASTRAAVEDVTKSDGRSGVRGADAG
jgi:hypothetical protein